jgi:hypothetical protein
MHIGMPRTGSSAIQHLLAAHRDALESRGYVYPRRWCKKNGIAQHMLGADIVPVEMEDQTVATPPAVWGEFVEYVRQERDRQTIISTESLSRCLYLPHLLRILEGFFADCAAEAPLRVILVVRRFDTAAVSMYLHKVRLGRREALEFSVPAYVEHRLDWMDAVFDSIASLRRSDRPWQFTLIPYAEGGDTVGAMLRAFDLDRDALNTDKPASVSVTSSRRQGSSTLGLKAQSLLANSDRVLGELGVRRDHLVPLFGAGEFEFANEVYDYDPLGYEARKHLHEQALQRARELGITDYVEAFGDAEIPRMNEATVDPARLTAEDIGALLSHLRRNPPAAARRRRLAAVGARTGLAGGSSAPTGT